MTENMPDWFCVIHNRALKSLTEEWQIAKILPESFSVYEDLVESGIADRRIEHLMIGGRNCGCRHYYRLSK